METHFGYYITGKERTEEISTTEVRCTENHDHIVHPKQKFCGECGAMVGPVTVTEQRTLWYDDIPDEDITDHLIFPEYCDAPAGEIIAVSNYGAGGLDIDGHDYNEIAIDNLEEVKRKHFEEFMTKHAHDIELLKKYVYDDVEIKYGFVSYDY